MKNIYQILGLTLSHLLQFFKFICLSGVDDGHFQKVLDNEIRALQNACKGILPG